MRHPFSRNAFTLIELLIVVAIIAILAAIAVPNFLEAQVRSKVSRVKADQRSLATALEAYVVDTNHYPPSHATQDGTQVLPLLDLGGILTNTTVHPRIQRLAWLTTPVAFITSIPNDPFAPAPSEANALNSQFPVFTYWDAAYSEYSKTATTFLGPGQQVWSLMPEVYGARKSWTLMSYGPDRLFEAGVTGTVGGNNTLEVYDPTNGTVSDGDIYRAASGVVE